MSGQSEKGFLPCFSKHKDSHFGIDSFYANSVFVSKVQHFLQAILTSPTTQSLREKIHPKGGIQPIDPLNNKVDRDLCARLGWANGKIYRVDYGDNAYRLVFGLDNAERRCHILALDTNHGTRKVKRKSN